MRLVACTGARRAEALRLRGRGRRRRRDSCVGAAASTRQRCAAAAPSHPRAGRPAAAAAVACYRCGGRRGQTARRSFGPGTARGRLGRRLPRPRGRAAPPAAAARSRRWRSWACWRLGCERQQGDAGRPERRQRAASGGLTHAQLLPPAPLDAAPPRPCRPAHLRVRWLARTGRARAGRRRGGGWGRGLGAAARKRPPRPTEGARAGRGVWLCSGARPVMGRAPAACGRQPLTPPTMRPLQRRAPRQAAQQCRQAAAGASCACSRLGHVQGAAGRWTGWLGWLDWARGVAAVGEGRASSRHGSCGRCGSPVQPGRPAPSSGCCSQLLHGERRAGLRAPAAPPTACALPHERPRGGQQRLRRRLQWSTRLGSCGGPSTAAQASQPASSGCSSSRCFDGCGLCLLLERARRCHMSGGLVAASCAHR